MQYKISTHNKTKSEQKMLKSAIVWWYKMVCFFVSLPVSQRPSKDEIEKYIPNCYCPSNRLDSNSSKMESNFTFKFKVRFLYNRLAKITCYLLDIDLSICNLFQL